MKVIAKVSDELVLCEVNLDEITKLLGLNYTDSRKAVGVGFEIPLELAFITLETIRKLNLNEINYARERAKMLLSTIDEVSNSVDLLLLLDTLAKDHTGDK